MSKAELRSLLEKLTELDAEDSNRSVKTDVTGYSFLSPSKALADFETMSVPGGPVVSVMNGQIKTGINPDYPWDGPNDKVEFELGDGSLGPLVKASWALIDSWK